MREILFEGKRVDNDEWVEGFYVCVPEHYKPEMSGKSYIVSINNGISFEVVPETVREYTGLTDRNGKRIFEGDIIGGRGDTYKVIFEDGIFLIDNSHYTTGLYVAIHMEKIDEVIGDVYNNPELLEVERNEV